MNAIYDLILADGQNLIEGKSQNNLDTLQKFYTHCGKLYLIDRFVWSSMFSDHDEIFYADVDQDPRWKEIFKRRQEVVLNNDHRLMKSA